MRLAASLCTVSATLQRAEFLRHFHEEDAALAEEALETFRTGAIVYYFTRRGFCRERAEDLSQETILRAMQRVSGGIEISTGIRNFCYGIARNILLEVSGARRFEDLEQDVESKMHDSHRGLHATEVNILLRQVTEAMSRCLGKDNRELVISYFRNDSSEERKQLAQRAGLSENAMRIRVCRAIEDLRQHLKSRNAAVREIRR